VALPLVGDGEGDLGAGRIGRILHEAGHSDRPFLAVGRQHDEHQRDVMHPVDLADQPLDHRVVEVTERGQESPLPRLRRQTAEHLAQRLAVGG